MIRFNFAFCFIFSFFLLTVPTSYSKDYILTFKDTASRKKLDRHLKTSLDFENRISLQPVFSSVERHILKEMKLSSLAYSYEIEFTDEQLSQKLRNWVQENRLHVTLEENSEVILSSLVDPFETLQWGLHNTGKSQPLYFADFTKEMLPAAEGEDARPLSPELEEKIPAQPITVAVLDTGLDIGTDMRLDKMHIEFKDVIAYNKLECDEWAKYQGCIKSPGKSKATCQREYSTHDMDGNGYPMDCMGWNVVADKDFSTQLKGSPDIREIDEGHGTHVSGIIAAAGGNGYGVRGIARNARILPVKVIVDAPNNPIAPKTSSAGSAAPLPKPSEFDARAKKAFVNQVARGMLYALRTGARVINMSMGWPGAVHTGLMNDMIQAAKERGVVVVVSAGNDSTLANTMPCNHEDVVCVGGHSPAGELAHYSNYGSAVDVSAPGTGILSTWPRHKVGERFSILAGYGYQDGTSMATPFIAGAVARLLGVGMSSKEAVTRILAGARPLQPNPQQSPYLPEKYIRTGNLDLTRSITMSPEPLILPATKEKNGLLWDRKSKTIPFSISLKNSWIQAKDVLIEGELLHPPTSPAGVLSTSSWQLKNWVEDEVKILEGAIEVDDPLHLAQDLILKLKIKSTWGEDLQQSERELKLELNVRVPFEKLLADPKILRIPIQGLKFDQDTYMKTFITHDPAENPEYLFVKVGDPKWELQILNRNQDHYEVGARGEIDGLFSEFVAPDGRQLKFPAVVFGLYKLDADFDGKEDYVVFFKDSNPFASQITGFKILYFNRDDQGQLSVMKRLDYDNQNTHIPDNFQWLKISDLSGQRKEILVPAWVAEGKKPKSELPTYDPFNRDPAESKDSRMYYLSSEGQKTLPAPKNDYYFIRTLSPTLEQQKKGIVPVLLGKGKGYKTDYATSVVQDNELQELKELVLPEYKQLYGLLNVQNILSLDQDTEFDVGTAITGPATQGALRTTFLPFHRSDLRAVDTLQAPVVYTDAVATIAAAFMGRDQLAVYGQTHYELQYFDLATNQTALSTLNKYSYMPAFLSYNLGYIPITVQMSGRVLPSVLISASWAKSGGDEIVVPHYNDSGKLLGLIRPARYKILPQECSSSPVQIDGTGSWPTQLVFFCKDFFVRLPLQD